MNSERPDVSGESCSGEGPLRAAIMFADIRDFTPLTHRLRTRDVPYTVALGRRDQFVTIADLLRSYLPEMSACIYAEQGQVDKFIGDGIMAFFMEKEPDYNLLLSPALRSIYASLRMQECFQRVILPQWEEEWLNDFRRKHNEIIRPRLGIGIAYGEAEFVRLPGKREGLQYTAVGEVVNLASRLESIAGKNCKFKSGREELLESIVVSGTILEVKEVQQVFDYQEYPQPISLKGIPFPQRIGSIRGLKE